MEFLLENIHLKEVFVQLAAFVLLFLTLRRFAWRPILRMLEERRERIAEGQRQIEWARKELAQTQQEYERRIQKIEEEARLKIQEAIHDGKRIAQEIREAAREESREILTKARANMELEIAKAQAELKNRVVELTLQATEKILQTRLDHKKDRELIDGFLTQLIEERKG